MDNTTPANVGLPKMRVGFIGLGLMGKPMAGHIVKAGYPLTVHNRSQAAVDEHGQARKPPPPRVRWR